MMQVAQQGHLDDLALARTLHWSRFRGILVQTQVRAIPVIVSSVGFEQSLQVSLVEDNDVIQTLAPD
jgi:hypothetical protein